MIESMAIPVRLHKTFGVRVGTIHGSCPTFFGVPLAMSITHTLRSVSV